MPEKFRAGETDPENIYKPNELISDYLNELKTVYITEEGKIFRYGKMQTVEERFAHDEGYRDELIKCQKKVARINQMTEVLNTTDDVTHFKRAYNEIMRLLYGNSEDNIIYTEKEFDPNLLGG